MTNPKITFKVFQSNSPTGLETAINDFFSELAKQGVPFSVYGNPQFKVWTTGGGSNYYASLISYESAVEEPVAVIESPVVELTTDVVEESNEVRAVEENDVVVVQNAKVKTTTKKGKDPEVTVETEQVKEDNSYVPKTLTHINQSRFD